MNKYVNRNAALLMLCALSAPAIAGDAPITVTISGTMVPSTCKISAPAVVSLPTVTLNEMEMIKYLDPIEIALLPKFSHPLTLSVDKASCGQTSGNHGVYLAFNSSSASYNILKNTALNGAKGVGIALTTYDNSASFNSLDLTYFHFTHEDDSYGEIRMAAHYAAIYKEIMSAGPVTADTTVSVVYN